MNSSALSPSEKRRGRKLFLAFGVVNTASFLMLSGNIITLFALRLGASSSYIGAIASLPYLSFAFMILGKRFVPGTGVVRLFGTAWIIRALCMAPLIVTPYLIARGLSVAALALLLACVFLFHAIRGVGMTGENPIMGALSSGRDRGGFLARFQIVVAIMQIFTGILIAFLLGEAAPIERYLVFFMVGILLAIVAALFLLQLPEPPSIRLSANQSLITTIRGVFAQKNFSVFIRGFAMFGILSGIARSFLIVYAKQGYGQADSTAILFTVVGAAGAVAMGYSARFLIDRLGAKPIYLSFSGLFLVSLLPLVLSPELASGTPTVVFLSAVFFLGTMGFAGGETSAQVYFFGLVDGKDQLNLGVLYFLTLGFGGTVGSLLGGVFLDLLQQHGPDSALGPFRIFFGAMAIFLVITMLFNARLERRGARSLASTMGVIFSLRDLRAIGLLHRLDQSSSEKEESQVLSELGESHSPVALEELRLRLGSPSFTVRSEALHALERVPVDAATETKLVEHVSTGEFTTANLAARVIGKQRLQSGRGALREALYSEDYSLAAAAILALAELDDRKAMQEIEVVARVSTNPLILIHACEAFRVFGSSSGIPIMLDLLRRDEAPIFVRDEVVISISAIIKLEGWFYPLYLSFLRNPEEGVDALEDFLSTSRIRERAAAKHRSAQAKAPGPLFDPDLEKMLSLLMAEPQSFAQSASHQFTKISESRLSRKALDALEVAAGDEHLYRYQRIRFFLAALILRLHAVPDTRRLKARFRVPWSRPPRLDG